CLRRGAAAGVPRATRKGFHPPGPLRVYGRGAGRSRPRLARPLQQRGGCRSAADPAASNQRRSDRPYAPTPQRRRRCLTPASPLTPSIVAVTPKTPTIALPGLLRAEEQRRKSLQSVALRRSPI